jgi:dTDP-4-dehydrorhamnose reductase
LPKLLIFGASGFVGSNLLRRASGQWDVWCADKQPREEPQWIGVDIGNRDEVGRVVDTVGPDAVVNVAALADIDLAEREKELAHRINVEGARNIAEACAERDAKYVFFSSDAVFDGNGRGYTEDDPCAPVNYYGETKAEAEKAVMKACPKAVVVRISLVLGFPVWQGNSFVAGLEKKLATGATVVCPTEEVRTPVDVVTLCECVLELAGSDFSGIVHIGGTESMNRYELTRALAMKLGYDATLVKPQPGQGESSDGRAPRHRNGIISVARAQAMLQTPLLSVEQAIERAIAERPKED